MKRIFKLVVVLVLMLMVGLNTLTVHAATAGTQSKEKDYQAIAKMMIEKYDTLMNKTSKSKADKRFTNDKMQKQQEKKAELNQLMEKAKKNGEKFYTNQQILNAKASDFGISQKDMDRIKGSIKAQMEEQNKLLAAFKALGESNHPVAKNLRKQLHKKMPKSLIYVDHSMDKKDGTISGGGWPYCLDDNGYSYRNFVTSDCYKAMISLPLCAPGMASDALHYCKPYERNCSWIINHSKYWHTHAWYQKIP